MKSLLNAPATLPILGLLACFANAGLAADGAVELRFSAKNVLLKVAGDGDDDWWQQSSTNLTTWTTLTSGGPLLWTPPGISSFARVIMVSFAASVSIG